MHTLSIITQTVRTMSSREIASLVDATHTNIKISAERLAARGVIGTLATQEFEHNGNTYIEYLFSKRNSLILVAQNCPQFTARIVDRWQELEDGLAPAVPQSLSAALRLAADQAEQIEAQQAALAIAAPKVAFVERYVEATGLKGFREVCKLLKANEARFREFVTEKKILYKLGGAWTAYQPHLDAGRFEVRTGVAESEHAFSTTKFTAKGVDWIAGEWAKHQLREEVAA